ncbi:MAG: alpha/beta fold hydrolase [Kiritimatiellia bacterium]
MINAKKWIWQAIRIAFAVIAVLPTKVIAEGILPIDEARSQTISGRVLDGQTSVKIHVHPENTLPGTERHYDASVNSGTYFSVIKLFPGVNQIEAVTPTGKQALRETFTVDKPALRVDFNCSPVQILKIYVANDCNTWGFITGGSIIIPNAEAGIYSFHVSPIFTPGIDTNYYPTVTATVNIFLNEAQVYSSSITWGDWGLPGGLYFYWPIESVVIHSGDKSGGYFVDENGNRDITEQGARVGLPLSLAIGHYITEFTGNGGGSPIFLNIGKSAQFKAKGNRVMSLIEDQNMFDCFYMETISGADVAIIDELGVLTALSPGHVQVYVWDPTMGYSVPIDVYVLKVDLVPDYDRSGVIDDDDRTMSDAGDKFYFWLNDDDDSGFEDDTGAGKMDIPGAETGWLELDGRDPDYGNNTIDSERDWVDFFPVFVDLKPTLDLIGTVGLKYVLKHTGGAVNAYIPNDLAPADAAKHLRDYTYAHAHADATVCQITATGYELPTAFLNAVKNDGKGVILLEGRTTSTSGKLVIEVQKSDGTPICSRELALSLDDVEKMFFHKNLRSAGGGSGGEADRTTAPNYPDKLCNGKQFVFIHGYNVNRVQARGWEAEIFKRMYWARNNARFHAITWYGYESQAWAWYWPWWGYVCPNYHNNIVNAWETAPAVKDYLAGLSGDVYLAAHSLGNMVASCSLMIDSSVITKYFMLDAAVASEAFDASQFNENMLHSNWLPYEELTDLYASEWHSIFGSGDQRSDLTWQGRFSSIASKCVNLYSSGDQVFDVHAKETEPDVFEVMPHVKSGRYSWAFQEKRKGSSYKPGGDAYTFSSYAGWSFNDADPPMGWTTNNPVYDPETDPQSEEYILVDATTAAAITTNQLGTKPFFGMGAGDFRNNLFATNGATANAWLNETNKWRVIAGTIPTMSLAAGRVSLSAVGGNVDMNSSLKPSYWPDRNPDPNIDDFDWLHSDIRNMAYVYTYKLFDEMIVEGGLDHEE